MTNYSSSNGPTQHLVPRRGRRRYCSRRFRTAIILYVCAMPFSGRAKIAVSLKPAISMLNMPARSRHGLRLLLQVWSRVPGLTISGRLIRDKPAAWIEEARAIVAERRTISPIKRLAEIPTYFRNPDNIWSAVPVRDALKGSATGTSRPVCRIVAAEIIVALPRGCHGDEERRSAAWSSGILSRIAMRQDCLKRGRCRGEDRPRLAKMHAGMTTMQSA